MKDWMVLLFLIYEAMEDFRTRSISLVSLILFGGLGLCGELFFWKMGAGSVFLGIAVGIFLMTVSLVSNGAIGMGDGAVFLVTGIFLGGVRNVQLVSAAMIAAMLCGGVGRIFRRKIKEIPFVPCVLCAYLEVMFFAA